MEKEKLYGIRHEIRAMKESIHELIAIYHVLSRDIEELKKDKEFRDIRKERVKYENTKRYRK